MKETTLFGLRVAYYCVIAGCLLIEGFGLAMANFSYWAPWYVFVVGFFWAITCIAAVYETIKSRPVLVLLASCAFFAASAVLTWLYSSDEKTLVWFLYQHFLELGVIAAALVLCFIPQKADSQSA